MDQEIVLCVSLFCFSLTFFFIIIFVFCCLCCVEDPARRACERGGGVCGLRQLRSAVFSGAWMLYLLGGTPRNVCPGREQGHTPACCRST
uniref:Uncharacterized protein n=1 Tax=Ixodes ricinus TaxID=34613 RepID=A0A147BCB6_IXORI